MMALVVVWFFPEGQTFASDKSIPKTSAKPNILFILVDDLGYADLGCQGSKDIRTPNIDSIAKSGIRFTDAYVTSPQCGPSRAGIMTGVSQARFSYIDNQGHKGLPDPQVLPLMPEYLNKAGYRTGMVGKWHIGQGTEWMVDPKLRMKTYQPLLPKKRIEAAMPWKRGFDEGFFGLGGSGHYFPFKKPYSYNPRSHFFAFNGADNEPKEIRFSENAYKTDFLTDAALNFIGKADDRPFFLYLAYYAPHTPLQAKTKDINANGHIKDGKRRKFAGMMTCLDGNIGRVLDLLDQKGIRDNTLVVFMSDNGGPTSHNTSRNDPYSGVKGDVYEGGIRVPFMVSWPSQFPKGKVLSGPVISLDLLPTFAAAAEQNKISDLCDGKNLLPWLKGKANCPNDEIYWSWRGNYNAIRSGTLKEVRNGKETKAADGTPLGKHIFADLATNPKELPGKALKDEKKKTRLSERLDAWLLQVKEDTKKLTPKNETIQDNGIVKDLVTPVMTNEKPAPGKRVRQVALEYKGTDVYHSLYLPVDWKPSGKYPVIVEYTGNKAPFCNSTGQVKDANLGYGISGGKGFIWVSMPYIEKGRNKNAVTWWGDRQATIEYCKKNLPRICKQFGGDPDNVFICGFSRGAIGASYIGLADDEIASLWKGMFTHDHFDGHIEKWPYPESDRKSALKRLARLKGRPVLVCGSAADYLKDHLDLARFTFLDVPVEKIFNIPEGKVIHPHTDMWMHRQSKYRKQARAWLHEALKEKSDSALILDSSKK